MCACWKRKINRIRNESVRMTSIKLFFIFLRHDTIEYVIVAFFFPAWTIIQYMIKCRYDRYLIWLAYNIETNCLAIFNCSYYTGRWFCVVSQRCMCSLRCWWHAMHNYCWEECWRECFFFSNFDIFTLIHCPQNNLLGHAQSNVNAHKVQVSFQQLHETPNITETFFVNIQTDYSSMM